MAKPNNTAAENAVRSKNVPPRTRRLAMNPLSTVRKIRACENEAAAQLLLERYAMSPQREPDPGQQWKCGDEFLPFHPQASHVPAEYRDGWNRCYWMAVTRGVAPTHAYHASLHPNGYWCPQCVGPASVAGVKGTAAVEDRSHRHPNCVNPDCNCVMRCEAEALPRGVTVPGHQTFSQQTPMVSGDSEANKEKG